MKTPQQRAEEVVRNQAWYGRNYLNPPGDHRVLASLIAEAIEQALTEPTKQAEPTGDRAFRKTKA